MTNSNHLVRKTKELRDVSFVLRNLFGTGSMVASEVMRNAGLLLPKYKKVFDNASKEISLRGTPISIAVEPLFDNATMAVIKAGEHSGSLDIVFDQIWKAAKVQTEINKTLKKLISPLIVGVLGVIVSFLFITFLIPYIYASLSSGAPAGFEPSILIKSAVWLNSAIMGNYELSIVCLMIVVSVVGFLFTQARFVNWLTSSLVGLMLKFEFIGVAYANLKFGILTQYIQIVSTAGIDAERRIDLVIDSLPVPLRPALQAFRNDMITRGIPFAASADGKPEQDPRHSIVMWPRYVRLAFAQANEGDWIEPMKEFGNVMIEDGREAIELRIGIIQNMTLAFVGILITIPMGSLYVAMGQIMQMRMQGL
tara:strand:+ start:1170 stop:2267 length:1098 start_codon:yes stop_codon:yes gene_type:complete